MGEDSHNKYNKAFMSKIQTEKKKEKKIQTEIIQSNKTNNSEEHGRDSRSTPPRHQ